MSNCERMARRHLRRTKAAALILDAKLQAKDPNAMPIGWGKTISRQLRMNVDRLQYPRLGRRIRGTKDRAKRYR